MSSSFSSLGSPSKPRIGISGISATFGGDEDVMEPPFPRLEVDLSRDDLRETVYEVLVYCCCTDSASAPSSALSSVTRLNSFKNKVLGSNRSGNDVETLLDIARSQMGISRQRDSGIRKVFSKAATKTEETEARLVPLELLLHVPPSSFPTKQYAKWRKRLLKVLEAGLLVYPAAIHPDSGVLAPFIKKEIAELWDCDKSLRTSAIRRKVFQELTSAAYWLAGEECNWANGFPLNVHLYDVLLWSLFSSTGNMCSTMNFDMEQAHVLAQKTWGVLGIEPSMHHVCFAWVLFCKFLASGDQELLVILCMEMKKTARLLRLEDGSMQTDLFTSVLQRIQRWSESRLYGYHEYLSTDESKDVLHHLVDMSVIANEFLETWMASSSKVEDYIESSLQLCFSQMFKEFSSHGKLTATSVRDLAEAVFELAAAELQSFSPLFRQWHPSPATVAISTLHTCYRRELKQFLLAAREADDITRSLESAASLERKLMELLPVEQRMITTSFACDPTIFDVLQRWLRESFIELCDWIELGLKHENEECVLSGVQYLRFAEDILEALVRFPIYGRPEILREFVLGVEATAERFVRLCTLNCGSKDIVVLTDQNATPLSTMDKVIKLCKQTSEKVWSELTSNSSTNQHVTSATQELCHRLNTLFHVKTGLLALEVKLKQREVQLCYQADENISLAKASQYFGEGIQKLCDAGHMR